MNEQCNIFEVLEYGPIVAKDDGNGLLVTLDGNRLYVWNQVEIDSWVHLETLVGKDLTTVSMPEIVEAANELLRDYNNQAV